MNVLPDPSPASLCLIIAYRADISDLLDLIARLALRGRLRVLDGGNCFNAYRFSRPLARALGPAGRGEGPTLEQILRRIYVARAFTCYQALTLLSETPAEPVPTFVLDLLATFYDESIPTLEALRLLKASVKQLLRLSRQAPVLVSAAPPPPQAASEREGFLEILEDAAHQIWVLELHSPPDPQIPLPL